MSCLLLLAITSCLLFVVCCLLLLFVICYLLSFVVCCCFYFFVCSYGVQFVVFVFRLLFVCLLLQLQVWSADFRAMLDGRVELNCSEAAEQQAQGPSLPLSRNLGNNGIPTPRASMSASADQVASRFGMSEAHTPSDSANVPEVHGLAGASGQSPSHGSPTAMSDLASAQDAKALLAADVVAAAAAAAPAAASAAVVPLDGSCSCWSLALSAFILGGRRATCGSHPRGLWPRPSRGGVRWRFVCSC